MTGTELKMLRRAHRHTWMSLAKLLGVHWRTIAKWESGRFPINDLKAEAIRARLRRQHR